MGKAIDHLLQEGVNRSESRLDPLVGVLQGLELRCHHRGGSRPVAPIAGRDAKHFARGMRGRGLDAGPRRFELVEQFAHRCGQGRQGREALLRPRETFGQLFDLALQGLDRDVVDGWRLHRLDLVPEFTDEAF